MIEKISGYKVGDQRFFELSDAQKHALQLLVEKHPVTNVVEWVFENREAIGKILAWKTVKPKVEETV